LWSSAGLQMLIHAQFYQPAMWTSKVGQGDLVFGVWLGCAIGSVHTRLQVSLYTGYDVCHPGCPKMLFVHFDPCDSESRSNPRKLLHPRQVHLWCKFCDRRSLACRDNADISIFYDALKVGQGGLLFGLRQPVTSRSLCARRQVSVSSSYDLWQHLMSHTHRRTVFVQVIWIAQLAG